jgi:hypothetical protein
MNKTHLRVLRAFVVICCLVSLAAITVPGLAQDPRTLRLLQQKRTEFARAAAPALAQAIVASRARAIDEGVKPIPAAVKRRLRGYVPDDLLERVRYRVGLGEGMSLPGAAFEYNHTIAMTLGDVIIFRDKDRAETDASLWAHELQHVLQYDSWGVAKFAENYLTDWEPIEYEARAAASEFDIWEEVQKAKGKR